MQNLLSVKTNFLSQQDFIDEYDRCMFEEFMSHCDDLIESYIDSQGASKLQPFIELAEQCFMEGHILSGIKNTLHGFEYFCILYLSPFQYGEKSDGCSIEKRFLRRKNGKYVYEFVQLAYLCYQRGRCYEIRSHQSNNNKKGKNHEKNINIQ